MTTRSDTPADRIRVLALRLIGDGRSVTRTALRAAGFRASDSVLGDMINEMVADGTIRLEHLNIRHSARRTTAAKLPVPSSRSPREEERVEIPPRRFAGDPKPAPKPETLWESLAKTYWVPGRRALYRRGGLA